MSKDTPCSPASPGLLAHPAGNIPFGMGLTFPAIPPPLGQFIPMGMVPINSITMQHYMELASKSGLRPAMVAPMFGPSAMAPLDMLTNQSRDKYGNEYCGNIPQNGMEHTRTKYQLPGNFVSGHDIPGSTTSSDVHSLGSDNNPVMAMPSVFFLPFSPGGMAGYFPHYPAYNMPSKRDEFQPTDSKPLDNLPKQGVISPSKSEERNDSDELDVARILVEMQVPVLKQIQTSATMKSSLSVKATKDFNEVNNVSNENTSSNDGILSASSTASVPPSDCSSVTHQNSTFDVFVNNMPPVFQHCGEQNDKHLENSSINNVVMNKVDEQSSENTEERGYVSLDPNDEVRTEEMQLDGKVVEHPSDIKLEVISEGERNKPVPIQPMDDTRPEQLPVSNEEKEVQSESSEEEHLQELMCIKNEEMNVCSDQKPVEVVPKESPKSLSDAIATSFPSEPINPEFEDNNNLKQESPEEVKDQSDGEKDLDVEPTDELSSDENGSPQNNYKCGVCSQLFRSPLGLQKHIEFHMDDGKHYTCTICFMNFCDAPTLQEHQEKHTRKRPHKCKFCPKAFRDPGSLQKHVRVHTGEKPYKCKDCPRSFAEYSSLRKHQRVHTGEQPYKCKYCAKAFSISGNLQRHILIHTGERPYKCNFCTKAFNNPSHLRRHVKNLHFRGDAAIDEAMLSHYGNPGPAKTTENDSSLEKGTMKQENQTLNNTNTSGGNSPNIDSLASRNMIIPAL